MKDQKMMTMDGNEAVAHVAVRVNEVIAIYPITPSSAMGEWADAWTAEGVKNIWGTVPSVVEMQSEGGAAGAVHGALQTGALATTFTASQGLLLMIPNMYKIAGELTPLAIHVAARSIATHALSIFGDHSDVMSVRSTGFALLCSNSVQEAMDFALIVQAATLRARVPFIHFFDGFRTSHEVSKVEILSDDHMRAMISDDAIMAHRRRALSPDNPVLRGTAQNPDVFFQSREAANPFYGACSEIVQQEMDRFARLTGRSYRLFEYHGAAHPEHLIILMGSGCETAEQTVDYMNRSGSNVGILKVRLYRPFDVESFVKSIPDSVKAIAVLDRTKEPGSTGEPLYQDCLSALHQGFENHWASFKKIPKIVGGRYGLSSKEFTPAMVKSVFDNLAHHSPKNHFTVGIDDDVSGTSLVFDPAFSILDNACFQALFFGLGSDGTVGANKNSIKIIGENTNNYAQGYFVYDSRKSGAVTISHLRFGPMPIHAPYLVAEADFVACHQSIFLERYPMLDSAKEGGTFLLNSSEDPQSVWSILPREFQEAIHKKKLRFYMIDAYKVAKDTGMGGRINTIMQVCFFAISGVLPREQALEAIKESIRKTYAKKGEEVVRKNLEAVDHTLSHLVEVKIPASPITKREMPPAVSQNSPDFVKDVLGMIVEGKGDLLPVSAFPADGTYPTATAQYEKRNLAHEIPVWEPDLCIACGKCAMVCPHSVIRIKAYEPAILSKAPRTFKSMDAREPDWKGMKYTIQVAPEDCTGCKICVDVCPARDKSETKRKALNMKPQPPLREIEKNNWEFFLEIPEFDRRKIKVSSIRQQQIQRPLFEFSSACAGCGETPYLKLMSQLFGDRALIANATGCSSIYGGNLPTTPWAKDGQGRGPAWSNSLFEDNAEFGLGYRLSIDKQRQYAAELLKKLEGKLGAELVAGILNADESSEAGIYEQRERVNLLQEKLKLLENDPDAKQLLSLAGMLVKKSVWIVGGDGWAYDIGFGGLDHVLASGRNVNILVLDTEVYSNTGGQMSKATPRGAVAKFASEGKRASKKDLGLIAMSYGNVYVARVAMGAKDEHTLRVFLEAEAFDGPSIIIAYSHCIAHGIEMSTGMQNQKAAVSSGQWILFRHDPMRRLQGENPLILDSPAPSMPVEKYMMMENRFKMSAKTKAEEVRAMIQLAQEDIQTRWAFYSYLAQRKTEVKPEKETQKMPVPAAGQGG